MKWENKLIRILWSMSLNIWKFCNKDLHGHDLEDAQVRCREAIQAQVEAMYVLHGGDPNKVSHSAQYLFDKPLEDQCSSSIQYLRCWLRSVEIAMEQQATIQDNLRQQATRFFHPISPQAPSPPHAPDLYQGEDSFQTIRTGVNLLQSEDITSPSSYNLKRRARQPRGSLDSSSTCGEMVEPSPFCWQAHDIFWESNSSYSPSTNRDLPFNPDCAFSMMTELDSSHPASTDSDPLAARAAQPSFCGDIFFHPASTSSSLRLSNSSFLGSGQGDLGEPSPSYWLAHDLFWQSDSSYEISAHRDVSFIPDSHFDIQELQDSRHLSTLDFVSSTGSSCSQRYPKAVPSQAGNSGTGDFNSDSFRPSSSSAISTPTQPLDAAPLGAINRPNEVVGMLCFLQE